MGLTTDNLLKIYECILKEEQFVNDSLHKRLQYFTTIVTTLLGFTIAGILKSENWINFVLLTIGPISVIIISEIAQRSISRKYYIIMEIISSRAKIEQELGLNLNLNLNNNKSYWNNEPIISSRHLKSRKIHKSSQEFLNSIKDLGYNKLIKYLFRSFQLIGLFIFIGLIFLIIT